ncbi:MAG: MFS transporter [Acidimicrobiales bacterium]
METTPDHAAPTPDAPTADELDGIDPAVYARRWWTLSALCLSLLIVIIGNTTLNVALPTLSRVLGATNSQLQWMVDAYSLVFAGLLFTAGTLGDRFGRKGVLQGGLVLFGVATAYCAFVADSAGELIAGRVAMGVAGAMIMPATLSILTNVFPRRERARAVSIWAGISGSGAALGPLLTGFMLRHFSWNSVFTVNIPFVLVALAAGVAVVPRSKGEDDAALDPIGAVLSAVGLSTLVFALIEGPTYGWLSPTTLAVGAVGAAVLAVFVAWELRVVEPMLDVRLFRIPAFGTSALVLTLVFFALLGMFFSMSQLMQLVWGYTPLGSAVRMLPVSFVMVLVAPRSAGLAERYGKRRVVAGGMVAMTVGVLIMSMVGVSASYLVLLLGIVVMASGIALAMSPTTDLLMSAVPRDKAGMGSAMNDTTRELGTSLGVAVFGSLLASRYADALAGTVSSLPVQAREVARGSLGGALQVAGTLEPSRGGSLVAAAKDAWVSGFRLSLLGGALVIAVAAAIAYRFLPDQAHDVAAHRMVPVPRAGDGPAIAAEPAIAAD